MKLRNFLLLVLVLAFSVVACAEETTPVTPPDNTQIDKADLSTLTGNYKIDDFTIPFNSDTLKSDNYTLIQDFTSAVVINVQTGNVFTITYTLELESIFGAATEADATITTKPLPTLYYDSLANKAIAHDGKVITAADNSFILTISDDLSSVKLAVGTTPNQKIYNMTKIDDAVTPLPTNKPIWANSPIVVDKLDENPFPLLGRYYIDNFTYNKTPVNEKLAATEIANIENLLGLFTVTVSLGGPKGVQVQLTFNMQSDSTFNLSTTPDTYIFQDITKDIDIADYPSGSPIPDINAIFIDLGAAAVDTETLTLRLTADKTSLAHTLPITGTDTVVLILKKLNDGKGTGIGLTDVEMIDNKTFFTTP